MIADDNALNLLGQTLSERDIPIVFYGINNNPRVYFDQERLPKNVYGILERHLTIPLVRHINTMVPIQHKRVLVLMDDSTTSRSIKQVSLKGGDQNLVGKTLLVAKTIKYIDDWKKEVLQASKYYDAIILQTWYTIIDEDSQEVILEDTVLDWTGKNAQLPLFSVVSYAVGNNKAIAAFVLSDYGHGKESANTALALLSGEKPKRFQTSKSGVFYLNKSGLDRFNLTIPPKLINHAIYK